MTTSNFYSSEVPLGSRNTPWGKILSKAKFPSHKVPFRTQKHNGLNCTLVSSQNEGTPAKKKMFIDTWGTGYSCMEASSKVNILSRGSVKWFLCLRFGKGETREQFGLQYVLSLMVVQGPFSSRNPGIVFILR